MFCTKILIQSFLNKDVKLSIEPVITGNTMIISSNKDINDTQHIYDLILKNNINEVHIEGDEIENMSSFRYIDSLKTIKITATKIKEIPDYCFSNCQNLQNVELNSGIEKIGKNSFEFTSISKINLENIKEIDDYAFKMCMNLQDIALHLIETMGICVFQSSGIKSLTFGDKIADISKNTAYNCLNITSVLFGDNVTNIGDYSFYNCINLENVQFKSSKFESIGQYSFYNTKLSTFPFHKNIKIINSYAFSFTKCQSIELPTTVVNYTIYSEIFSNLNNLEKIIFGDYYSMNSAKGVLMNCGNLKSVTIGQDFFVPDYFCYFNKNLETIQGKPSHIIGQYAFAGCTSLQSINIEGIKIISQYAFQHCHNLKINLWPDNSLTIDDCAFQYCDKLEISEIKENYELSDRVFEFCQGIKTLTIQSNTIGSSVFHGCLNLKSIIINSSFNEGMISERSFYQCSNLETVELSDKIYEISDYSFAKTKIKEINLNNIRMIGKYSFMDSKITKLTIFETNQISNFAFHNSTLLTDLTLNNSDANFNLLAFTCCFNMKNFNFINSKFEFKEKMIINNETMILLVDNDITEYNVPEYIKEIQSFCFILSSNLEKPKIGHFVTINSYSFANSSIKELCYSVELPGNEEPREIKKFGFSFMEKVEKIEIPREITELPESCFECCPSLLEIDLSNIQKIPQNCFKNSGKLTSVTFSKK